MNVKNHWLEGAERDLITGGGWMTIRRCLVIHYTQGASGRSSIDYWKELDNGICAHLVIERNGYIYQVRPFNRTCGHAGVSRWRDPSTFNRYKNINHCSIGIELANAGNNEQLAQRWTKLPLIEAQHRNGGPVQKWEAFPEEQVEACIDAARAIVSAYHLDDVTGHDCVAPERKLDPGPAFPMERIRKACGFSGLPDVHLP